MTDVTRRCDCGYALIREMLGRHTIVYCERCQPEKTWTHGDNIKTYRIPCNGCGVLLLHHPEYADSEACESCKQKICYRCTHFDPNTRHDPRKVELDLGWDLVCEKCLLKHEERENQ